MDIPKKKWETLLARVERLEKNQGKLIKSVEGVHTVLLDMAGGPNELENVVFGPYDDDDEEIDDDDKPEEI